MSSSASPTTKDEPAGVLHLTRRVRIAYAAGSVANGSFAVFGGLTLFFFNQIVGVPAHLVSLALSVTIVVDALWDPLIGHSSDRLRSHWGRRHPFIYAGLLLIPIALYFRWHPPIGWSIAALFSYVLGTGLLVNLAYSLYEVPSGALAPELAPGYHQRTVLLGQRWAFGALGAGLATVLVYGVFLRATPEFPIGQLNGAGYGPMSIALAGVIVTAGLVLAVGTQKAAARLHRPPEASSARIKDQLADAWATLRNRNFVVVLAASLVAGLGSGLSSGLGLYFNTYFWGLESNDILVLTLLGIPIPILAASIAPRISRVWGKKRACMTLFFASVAFSQAPMLLRLLGLFVPNDSPMLLGVLATFLLLAGSCGIAGFILVSSMIADIVEDVQATTGRRSEGLLFTADSLPSKLLASVSTILPGLLLSWVAFPQQARPGPETLALMTQLAWLYLPCIVVINVSSIGIWTFYRIDEASHERNLRQASRSSSSFPTTPS